jgi:hypothetical protein
LLSPAFNVKVLLRALLATLGVAAACVFIASEQPAYGYPHSCSEALDRAFKGSHDQRIAADLTGFDSSQDAINFVMGYYQEIDSKNIEAILMRFADNARYLRAGQLIVGKDGLREFYTNTRALDGMHFIAKIEVNGNAVVSSGQFIGKLGKQDVILTFVDIWWFGSRTRQTVFRESKIWKDGIPIEA